MNISGNSNSRGCRYSRLGIVVSKRLVCKFDLRSNTLRMLGRTSAVVATARACVTAVISEWLVYHESRGITEERNIAVGWGVWGVWKRGRQVAQRLIDVEGQSGQARWRVGKLQQVSGDVCARGGEAGCGQASGPESWRQARTGRGWRVARRVWGSRGGSESFQRIPAGEFRRAPAGSGGCRRVPASSSRLQCVPVGFSGFWWVPVGTGKFWWAPSNSGGLWRASAGASGRWRALQVEGKTIGRGRGRRGEDGQGAGTEEGGGVTRGGTPAPLLKARIYKN